MTFYCKNFDINAVCRPGSIESMDLEARSRTRSSA